MLRCWTGGRLNLRQAGVEQRLQLAGMPKTTIDGREAAGFLGCFGLFLAVSEHLLGQLLGSAGAGTLAAWQGKRRQTG